jgi:hypothetical protein
MTEKLDKHQKNVMCIQGALPSTVNKQIQRDVLCIPRPQHVLVTMYRLTKQVAQRMEHLQGLSFVIFTEN